MERGGDGEREKGREEEKREGEREGDTKEGTEKLQEWPNIHAVCDEHLHINVF